MSLSQLPTDLIIPILGNISDVREFYTFKRVSRTFSQAVHSWTKIDFSSPLVSFRVTDLIITKILASLPRLISLNLTGCSKITKSFFTRMVPYDLLCMNANKLSLSDQVSFDPSLLSFEYGLLRNPPIVSFGIFRPITRLMRLSLTGVPIIDDGGIPPQPFLVDLSLDYTVSLGVSLGALAGAFPNLQSLSLRGCARYDDAFFRSLRAPWPSLRNIDLSVNETITDATLHHLMPLFPSLRRAIFDECSSFTDAGIASVVTWCPSLVVLSLRYLRNITLDSLRGIAQGLPLLETLFIDGCVGIKGRIPPEYLAKMSLGYSSFRLCCALIGSDQEVAAVPEYHRLQRRN